MEPAIDLCFVNHHDDDKFCPSVKKGASTYFCFQARIVFLSTFSLPRITIMGTFITDKLQHLNNDLVQLFHLDAQPPIDIDNNNGSEAITSSTRRKSVHSNHSNDLHDDTQATIMTSLRASIDSLDLRSGVVPPMERVIAEIERVQGIVGSQEHEEGSKLSQLEHLFLAKCTVVVYLNLLDIILNATLPLSNEIEYWQSLLDGPKWRLLYILQSKCSFFTLSCFTMCSLL